MSHHFDTELSRKDPRLNICDFYLFEGAPGFTVMVMTTNGDAGHTSSDTFHPEGIYAFRFDRTGSNEEDLVFKFRFGEPSHMDGDEHRHVQGFSVLRSEGPLMPALGGDLLVAGSTGRTVERSGVKAFAGLVPDLWAADALGFRATISALLNDGVFDREAFVAGRNWFKGRNALAIVLEVPNELIGSGSVHAWSTISLFGHAPEMQICRFGYPLFTFLLLAKRVDLFDRYHSTAPKDDVAEFSVAVGSLATSLSASLGSQDPATHGRAIADRFTPSKLPYEIGTPASFSVEKINGRPLCDDALDAMWTLTAGAPVSDGVAPDRSRFVGTFPYYGEPYSRSDQAGFGPLVHTGSY